MAWPLYRIIEAVQGDVGFPDIVFFASKNVCYVKALFVALWGEEPCDLCNLFDSAWLVDYRADMQCNRD